MSNPTNEMGDRIQSHLKTFAMASVVFSLLPFAIVHFKDLLNLIESGQDKKFAIVKDLIKDLIPAVIGAVIMVMIAFFRRLDLHNFMDRYIVRARENVGSIIQKDIVEIAKSNNVSSNKISTLESNLSVCMDIFYYFANQQTEKRKLAFSYWETYFIHLYIYLFCYLSFLAFIITAGIINAPHSVYWLELVPVIIAIIFYFSTKSLLKNKIYDLPRGQLRDILSAQKADLMNQILTRT
jgi:hypothetical protein